MRGKLWRHVEEISSYVGSLGVRRGAAIYVSNVLERKKSDPTGRMSRLIVENYPHPMFCRLGTSDFAVFQQVIAQEDYRVRSPAHAQALRAAHSGILSRGRTPVIIDCGANIGLSAVWFAVAYPEAIVVAVEPEDGNFAVLTRNCEYYGNIRPIKAAVSDRRSRIALSNPAATASETPYSWRTSEDEAGDIASMTIDDILDIVEGGELFIVKIDIEGFEVEMFRTNTEWADRVPLVIYEAHDWIFNWRGTEHAIARVLTRQPRDYLRQGENTFALLHAMQPR